MSRHYEKCIHSIVVTSDQRIAGRRKYLCPSLKGDAEIIVTHPKMVFIVWHFKFATRRKFCIVFDNEYIGREASSEKRSHDVPVISIQVDHSYANLR